jgi:hypothetical protein
VSSSAALTAIYAAISAELRNTWQLEYLTSAQPGDRILVDVKIDGHTVSRAARIPGHGGTNRHQPFNLWLVTLLVTGCALVVGFALLPVARSVADSRRRTADSEF